MKAFIRKLNIEERKEYIYVIFYTFFQSISSILIKIMSEYSTISSLAVISERGSIISIICLCRIIISIRNDKGKREELAEIHNYKHILFKGFISCLAFTFMIISLYHCSMSTYFVIIRLTPFITLYIMKYLKKEEIKKYQVFGSIFGVIGALVIIIPSLSNYKDVSERDTPLGILCALIVMALLSFSNITNREDHRSKDIDIVILFAGVLSSGLGCLLMIIFTPGIGDIKIYHWIIIFISAICIYYAIFFQAKAVKTARNVNKIVPFSIASIFITFIFGVLFFNQTIYYHDIFGLLIVLINTIFYSKQIMKASSKKKHIDNDFDAYY